MPVTRAQYPVGPDSTLYSTALVALEVTKKCTLKTIEEEHTQLAEPPRPPPIEVNRGKPAKTSYEPVLTVFVPPFFCLSLFSWFPLLLRRIQHSNNAQGFLYNHSWQALSCPLPLRLLPFSQPALCKMLLFLQKWYQDTKYSVRLLNPGLPLAVLWTCLTDHAAVSSLYCLASWCRLKSSNVVGQQSTAHNGTCCAVSWERFGEQWCYCARHHYTAGAPLAVAHQATREAEKVFHWALIEKTPPWI